MKLRLCNLRFPLIALGLLALLTALWGGLVRLGWQWPLPQPSLPASHGPLMVCGFLGTLIGVERAVALGSGWAYATPMLTAAGVLALLGGLPAPWLMTLGSLGLVVVFLVIVGRQLTLATATMCLGALAWLVGNALWFTGWPIFRVVPWWTGFLVLTIAGERLELSRMLRPSESQRWLFLIAVGVFVTGLMVALPTLELGARLAGVGLLLLAWWLLRYDIARRTIRQLGLTRFIAVCLLSGYVWLGIGGLLSWRFGGVPAGPLYDAALHAVFVGFVFAMLLGHAPIVFSAVLGTRIVYHPIFYAPLLLLHLSLLLRLAGDLLGWSSGRQWGGLLNAVSILVFLGTMAGTNVLPRLISHDDAEPNNSGNGPACGNPPNR